MSAATQAFFALDREATEAFLTLAISRLDDITLKNAVHTLVSSYCPIMLQTLVKNEIVPTGPVVPTVPMGPEEPEMRTATDENVARLMKKKRIDWEAAWIELRCKELEDGESICCSEECEGNDSAIDELVWAAEAGKENRNERRIAQGRPVSPDASEEKDSAKVPYVAPPKVRDAELHWPFMRCKNVARALHSAWYDRPIPRNHHGLLEYIAKQGKVSVEVLKKTNARDLFKDNFRVMAVLGKSYRW